MVQRWFLHLSIRGKLLVSFASLVSFSLLFFSLLFIGFKKVEKAGQIRLLTGEVTGYLASYDAVFQQLMLEGFKSSEFQSSIKSQQEEGLDSIKVLMGKSLKRLESLQGGDYAIIQEKALELGQSFSRFDSLRTYIMSLLRQRGFKEFGDEGALRKAIHTLEMQSVLFDKSQVLMVRLIEKNFIMRKEIAYVEAFKEQLDRMQASLPSDSLEGFHASLIRSYNTSFLSLVETEQAIGFSNKLGLRSEIEQIKAHMLPLLTTIREQAKETQEQTQAFTWGQAITLLLIQVAVSIVLVVYISGLLSRRIKRFQSAMAQLSVGSFPESLPVEGSDELDKASDDFNHLVKRVESATSFATELGNGNLHVQYNESFGRDVLANAITGMQQKLIVASEEQSKLNWVNKGLAEFAEVASRISEGNKQALAEQVLKAVIQYLDMTVGALYLLDEESNGQALFLASAYAYGRKKYLERTILVGEGLLGQCCLEKEPIILTEVPDAYLTITSGLGEANPTYVVLMPLIHQSTLIGVIELAGFKHLEPHAMRYLTETATRAASSFASIQSTYAMQRLLETQNRHTDPV